MAVRVLGVYGRSPLVLRQQILDLPIVHAGADGKLEVLLCYGVPILRRRLY